MINVLHVVSLMNRGGQETFIMNVYRNIDHSKINFKFLCSDSRHADYDEEIKELGGDIFYLDQPLYTHGIRKGIEKIKVLKSWFGRNKKTFDIVHLHTYHAYDALLLLISCRIAGVKNIIVHSHNTSGPHPHLHLICRFFCGFFKHYKFACGREAGKWMFGPYITTPSFRVINNGIKTSDFKYNESLRNKYRRDLNIEDKFVVGHIGRFHPQKNHELLIDAFYKFHEYKNDSVLLLIGDGDTISLIKRKIKQYGIEDAVLFLGIRNDVPQLLNSFDLFLFPSIHEGLSVCAIEVQCNGLKILTSDIPSMREANITGTVCFESLLSPSEVWANHILSIDNFKHARDSYLVVKQNGYDILDVASNLQSIYEKIFLGYDSI